MCWLFIAHLLTKPYNFWGVFQDPSATPTEDPSTNTLILDPTTEVSGIKNPRIHIATVPSLENGLVPSPVPRSSSGESTPRPNHLEVDSDDLYSNPSRPLTPTEPNLTTNTSISNSGRPISPGTAGSGIGSYFRRGQSTNRAGDQSPGGGAHNNGYGCLIAWKTNFFPRTILLCLTMAVCFCVFIFWLPSNNQLIYLIYSLTVSIDCLIMSHF